MRVRVRLFAIQRELAGTREVPLELPDGATIEDAWSALVDRHPALAPGRAFVRFARNADYADADTVLEDGDELAVIPPVSGGADRDGEGRILELRSEPFGTSILAELGDRLATDDDGAIVGFIGRTRRTAGTPAPGQEAEAELHAGRDVEGLTYEAHELMVLSVLERIATEIAERFAVTRIAIVHRTGEVPLGDPSVAIVAVAPHRDAAFAAARYGIDETKARAPIWKAERFADGHVWVGEPAREGPRPGATAQGRGGFVKVYISVDMEGIAGVSHPGPTDRKDSAYPAAVDLMVGEANAAIEGAMAGGATDILVNDSHGGMYNLKPADLHPAARILQGQKAWSMVAGAGPDAGIGVALFIGYHARAGHPRGTIAHTYSGRPTVSRLNGRLVGETGLNAAVLGQWEIPVGLVSGDDALAEEVGEWLPEATQVVVKEAAGGNAAASLHPSRAGDLIRTAAESTVRRALAGAFTPLVLDPPIVVEVEYRNAVTADYAAIVPGAERFGDRGVRFEAPDAVSAYRGFLAGVRLASIVD